MSKAVWSGLAKRLFYARRVAQVLRNRIGKVN